MKTQKLKYDKLLDDQVNKNGNSKEKAVLKENEGLKQKIESLLVFKRQHDQSNTFKMLSTTQERPTVREDEAIKEELIAVIDKLKNRLKDSEEQMKVLHMKLELNKDLDIREALSNKARQLEKLEYKLAQLNEQAEVDHLYMQ